MRFKILPALPVGCASVLRFVAGILRRRFLRGAEVPGGPDRLEIYPDGGTGRMPSETPILPHRAPKPPREWLRGGNGFANDVPGGCFRMQNGVNYGEFAAIARV